MEKCIQMWINLFWNLEFIFVQVMGSTTKIYIVLEYVTGGELFDKIVTCKLSQ